VVEVTLPHPELYPFQGRLIETPVGPQHYLDEGSSDSPVALMLHGNPTWSFYFRSVVNALCKEYRCIVPDHIGCGLSAKPTLKQYDFSLESRIQDIERLVDSLNLKSKITLIVHDWGGMIGTAFATRHPEKIARIIAINTGCTLLPPDKPLPFSLHVARNTRLGEWLILKHNSFCRAAAKWCVTRKKLPTNIRAMYMAPHDTPAHRLSVLKFVQTIPLSESDPGYRIVKSVEEKSVLLRHVPTLLLWGLNDFVFDQHFLTAWQKQFPQAETHTWPDCGHYLLEDAPDEAIAKIQSFLKTHPVS
jgi:cis-3-alkyl-4-acyloxetan-2-one decarboxylase